MIFLRILVLGLYHCWQCCALFPWKVMNGEESLEGVYLGERDSFLPQSRGTHSLLEVLHCYIREIHGLLRLFVQCVCFESGPSFNA